MAEILDSPGQDPREIFFPAGPGLGLDAQGHKVESWLVHACGFKRDPVTGAITTKRKDHVHETSDGATVDKPSSPAFFNEAQEEGVPPLKPELVGDALQGDTQGNWHAPSADADAHAEEEEEEDDSNTLVIDCAGFRAAPEDSTTEGIHQWEEGQPALQGKGEPGQLAHGGPTFGRPSNAAPLVHMHSGKAGTALSGLGAAGPGSSTERDLFMYYCYSLQVRSVVLRTTASDTVHVPPALCGWGVACMQLLRYGCDFDPAMLARKPKPHPIGLCFLPCSSSPRCARGATRLHVPACWRPLPSMAWALSLTACTQR